MSERRLHSADAKLLCCDPSGAPTSRSRSTRSATASALSYAAAGFAVVTALFRERSYEMVISKRDQGGSLGVWSPSRRTRSASGRSSSRAPDGFAPSPAPCRFPASSPGPRRRPARYEALVRRRGLLLGRGARRPRGRGRAIGQPRRHPPRPVCAGQLRPLLDRAGSARPHVRDLPGQRPRPALLPPALLTAAIPELSRPTGTRSRPRLGLAGLRRPARLRAHEPDVVRRRRPGRRRAHVDLGTCSRFSAPFSLSSPLRVGSCRGPAARSRLVLAGFAPGGPSLRRARPAPHEYSQGCRLIPCVS